MLVSQILTDVRNELKETAAAFWSDTELIRLINRGVTDFVTRTFILQDEAVLTLEEGRSDYPVPGNWISARLIMHKQVTADGTIGWARVYPTNIEKVSQENPNFLDDVGQQGRPSRYFIWDNTISIKPAPSAENISDSNLKLYYIASASPITASNQDLGIPDSLADGITAFVLWKAWKKEEEEDAALEQRELYFDYVRQGLRFVKKRVGDERKMIDIESPVGFRQQRNPFDPLS